MSETVTDERRPSFSEWLAQHRGGSLDDDLTAALAEIAERVVLEGRPAAVVSDLGTEIFERTSLNPLWTP